MNKDEQGRARMKLKSSGLCLLSAPGDQALPRILGGLKKPEAGRRKHRKTGAASACCPARWHVLGFSPIADEGPLDPRLGSTCRLLHSQVTRSPWSQKIMFREVLGCTANY